MTTKNNKKNFKADASIQQKKIDHVVDFEEVRKYMKEEFDVDIDDIDTRIKLRHINKPEEKADIETKTEIHSWSKPAEKTYATSETPDRRRMSQGDKGFLGGLITAAGIWLLSKAGAKPEQPQQKPLHLTADEEFEIVEKHMMRDAYLRHISRQ